MALMMAWVVVFIVAMPGHMGSDRPQDAPVQASQRQSDDARSAQEPAPQIEQDARDKAAQ